jgi:hypothetical protein
MLRMTYEDCALQSQAGQSNPGRLIGLSDAAGSACAGGWEYVVATFEVRLSEQENEQFQA